MKKYLLLIVAPALSLASCSNDEVLNLNDNNEITFDVTASNNSRAANVFCNNNKPSTFNIYAKTASSTLIDGDEVTVTGGTGTTVAKYYWPQTGDVNFYGIVNGKLTFSEDGAAKVSSFSVNDAASAQTDLLYAVTSSSKAASKANDGAVDINFLHALSQIVFKAKLAENAAINVKVKGVTVGAVRSSGAYTLPAATVKTDNNIAHAAASNAEYYGDNRGKWNFTDVDALKNYSITFDAVNITTTTAVDLTPNESDKEYSSNALLLIPDADNKTKWNTIDKLTTEGKLVTDKGSFFIIDAEITQQAKGSGENAIEIWNGNIAVPADFSNWVEGKKYVYTFIFGKGNGGFNPDPEGQDPDPVLVQISYNVTVDEFIPADQDVEIGSETTSKTN